MSAKTAAEIGQCWKVRIVVGSAVIHALSSTEPSVSHDDEGTPRLDWTPIEGTAHGDTVGHMSWPDVQAITWRVAV